MRLQRYLAQAGVASRRHAETLIRAGRVRVNGQVVTQLGTQVDPARDRVECDGRPVTPQAAPEVWMLHKPRGVITTMRDPQRRRTVADLVKSPGHRLFPVGRLDAQTSGLLLFTDDGDLALRLTHPRWGVEKEYLVTVEGQPGRETREALLEGVFVEGRTSRLERLRPAEEFGPPAEGQTRWLVVIREGRHHVVRNLFAAVGHPVVGLHRVRVGPLTLGRLGRGRARRLAEREVAALRRAVGLTDGQEATRQETETPSERRGAAPRDRRRGRRSARAPQPPRRPRAAHRRDQAPPR